MPDTSTTAELEEKLAQLRKKTEPDETSPPASSRSTTAPQGELQSLLVQPPAQPWSPALVGSLSGGLLLFGVFIFVLIGKLIFDGKVKEPAGDSQWLLRILVVPLCVLTAVLLVIVGFSNEQTAPAIGLLGTIIGYLLGSGARGVGPAPGQARGAGTDANGEEPESDSDMVLLLKAKSPNKTTSIPAGVSAAISRCTDVRPIRLLRAMSHHGISGEAQLASLAAELTHLFTLKITSEELARLLVDAKDPAGDAICALIEKNLA